ncbi:MAG TPA: hypothetical protein P5238_03255 [Smithellaceae bacterium]|nr:hypothetical protein [Smithellaceae bacterium]HRV44768.1 hypothetical protein [Smithellaceae bacterium]
MAEKLDEKQPIEFKELLLSEAVQSDDLINISDRKGIVGKQGLLEEMRGSRRQGSNHRGEEPENPKGGVSWNTNRCSISPAR